MTEQGWLACTDPKPMLELLRNKASDRKLRLFACACCRRVWHLLADERSQRAVEVVERGVDGLWGDGERLSASVKAGEAAEAAHWENRAGPIQTAAEAAAMASSEIVSFDLAIRLAGTVAEAVGDEATDEAWDETWTTPGRTHEERWAAEETIYREAEAKERSRQADLLRCILGNPFRPVNFDDSWHTPEVISLAQIIYAERAFDRMPELAATLERAGCADEDILRHCRGAGPHLKGCWVVDLLLSRS